MGFPEGAQTTVLTMKLGLTDGSADREAVTITPSPSQIISTALDDIREGDPVTVTPDRSSGAAQLRLLNTDATGYNPSGWTYEVRRGSRAPYSISLPVSLGPTVDLADLTEVSESPGQYDVLLPVSELGTAAFCNVGTAAGTVAAGDDGRFSGGGGGGPSPSATVAAGTSFGASSTAGAATAYSRGDHAHGTPAAPTLAGLGGLAKASNLSDLPSAATARTNLGLGTAAVQPASAFDAAGAAGTVATALSAHTGSSTSVHGITDTSTLVTTADSRLANSRPPSGSAGGGLGGSYPNPSVEKIGAVAVSGTPSAGQVLTATGAGAATWQDPPAGGGGSGVVPVWYVDELNAGIIHLPGPTSSWTPVVGSNSVAIARDITDAAVGDVIEVDASFLRIGASMQLDARFVVSGTPVRYFGASSAAPTVPGEEGDPMWYSGSSFHTASATRAFVLREGEVDGGGNVRIELVYRGPDIPADDSHTLYFGPSAGYPGEFNAKHWKIGAR